MGVSPIQPGDDARRSTTRAPEFSAGRPWLVPGSHSALARVAGRHLRAPREPPLTEYPPSPPGPIWTAPPLHHPPAEASPHTSDWPESDPDQSSNYSQTPTWPLGYASSAGGPPRHRNAIARNWACTRPPPASREALLPTDR